MSRATNVIQIWYASDKTEVKFDIDDFQFFMSYGRCYIRKRLPTFVPMIFKLWCSWWQNGGQMHLSLDIDDFFFFLRLRSYGP